MDTNTNPDFPDLVRETQEIWEQNARWWDAKMGDEGNVRERVLELASGNGQFARRLASLGAHVVACVSAAPSCFFYSASLL